MKTGSTEAPVAAHDPYAHKWKVLAAVCVGLFMVLLDSSIVNVAIPSISKGLSATFAQMEWVLNAYTLVFASLLVTFGRLGDMFGRKRFFITGLIIFGVGSAACGFASTPVLLIAARVLQAFGAAFMMPATLSLTAVNFPPEQRGMAMGIWGAVSGLATAIGPSLGGWITEMFSWNAIFFINIPVVLFAVPFALRNIPESRDDREHRIDAFGAVLSIVTLAALSYALIEGPAIGWTERELLGGTVSAVMLFGVAAVMLALFIWWERRASEPIMDLALFRSVGFSAGNASGAIMNFGMMGMIFLLPVYMQAQLGYSATVTGLALTPMSIAIMFAAPLSGRLSDRFGSRWLVFAGILTMSAASLWFSMLHVGSGWSWLLAPLVVAGFGLGLVMAPTTSAVMAHAPRGEEGAASGVLSTIRQIGGVMGIAVLGAVFQTSMTSAMASNVANVDLLPKKAVPIVRSLIEDGGSGGMMGGMDLETMRSALPTETMRPLIDAAVRDAAKSELPEEWADRVAESVIAALDDGVSPTDQSALQSRLMDEMTPAQGGSGGMPPGATAGGGSGMPDVAAMPTPSQFAMFGERIGLNIADRFERMGAQFEDVAAEAFVEAMRRTFRTSAAVLLAGALLALLLRPGKNHYVDAEEDAS